MAVSSKSTSEAALVLLKFHSLSLGLDEPTLIIESEEALTGFGTSLIETTGFSNAFGWGNEAAGSPDAFAFKSDFLGSVVGFVLAVTLCCSSRMKLSVD